MTVEPGPAAVGLASGPRLQGRTVVVTGGGHGIGKAYCRRLAAEGAAVVIAELDEPAARDLADELVAADGQALAVGTDVADERSAQAMVDQARQVFGRVDGLVNNAAMMAVVPMSRVGIEELSVQEWDRLMAVNLRGMFVCCRAVLPGMRAQGAGKIVNISSSTVFIGSPSRIHYVTSKAGVLGFTRSLASEVGPHGITVNAIAPGSTLSEEDPDEEVLALRQRKASTRPLRRVQTPEDVVGALVFLLSADSDFITGQTLVVDGGDAMH